MKKLIILGALLATTASIRPNWFSDTFNTVTDGIKSTAQQAIDAAKKAAGLAQQEAQQAQQEAQKIEQEQQQGVEALGARIEQDAEAQAQAAAQAAAQAEAKVQQAAQQAAAKLQQVTSLATNFAQNSANQAVNAARNAANTVVVNPFSQVQNYANIAIAIVQGMTGHSGGASGAVNYVQIYTDAIHKALDPQKGKDGFNEVAYQILASLALSKELAMKTHVNWLQFKGILASYNFPYTTAQWAALQNAFQNGVAIPAAATPQPDLGAIIIAKLVETVNAQMGSFKQQFIAQFATLPGYLDQNPKVLAGALQDFIKAIWVGSAKVLAQYKVTWAKLQAALAPYNLDSAHLSAIQAALANPQ